MQSKLKQKLLQEKLFPSQAGPIVRGPEAGTTRENAKRDTKTKDKAASFL